MTKLARKILLLSTGFSSVAMGSWSVGNGGDSLRLAFMNAKTTASRMVQKIKPQSFGDQQDSPVVRWILANQDGLAADILASSHRWTLEAQATCAWTTTPAPSERIPTAAPIDFSYPACRETIENFGRANELLIHESVHHFGISDESFADAVAIAIVRAWTSGKTDWLTIAAPMEGSPAPRKQHSAVWTGQEMLVFGGAVAGDYSANTNTGHLFDPRSFSWREIARNGAPARHGHTAVWTGEAMIIWGGFKVTNGRSNWQNSGAIWTAATNAWQSLASPYGPTETGDFTNGRPVQAAVWTGEDFIYWGGVDGAGEPLGGIYNPKRNVWKRLSSVGAPIRLWGHSVTWVDGKLIVWGGILSDKSRTNTGAAYDPESDTWEPLPSAGAPLATERHSAIWTGKELVMFGGFDSSADLRGQGAVYDPSGGKWRAFYSEPAMGRTDHTGIWDGGNLLVFGGKSKRFRTYLNNVAAYSPDSQEWTSKQGLNSPVEREGHSAIWTGTSMIIWGGSDKDGALLADGGIYYP